VLPASAVATALLLSLVPGWFFLRLTEKARRPRHQSDLQEVLELVTVGVLTTGLAVAAVAILRPAGVLNLDIPPTEARDLRELASSVVGTFLLALGFAWVFAWIAIKRSPAPQSSLGTSVWWDILRAEKIPPGMLPYALVTLNDDTTVEGVLATYTWQSDTSHYRDIALRAPIRFPVGDGKSVKPTYDYLIIAGSDIKQLALKYTPK
jgi:hypothetical protein